jgi:hypothetical protein
MSEADQAAKEPAAVPPEPEEGLAPEQALPTETPATVEELGGEPPCQLPRFWDADEE